MLAYLSIVFAVNARLLINPLGGAIFFSDVVEKT